jgi:hypothetical protein
MESPHSEELLATAAQHGLEPRVLAYLRGVDLRVCIPMYGGLCTDATARGLVDLAITTTRLGMKFALETMRNESLITRARNNMVAGFLARPECTHLLFVDADIGFAATDVLRLLCSNVDVVGGLYPVKSLPPRYVFNAVPNPASVLDDPELLEVRHVGTGFVLIRRTVLEALAAAHPELRYRDSANYGKAYEPHMCALFDTSIDEAGDYLSEDWTFCKRWRDLGGRVFARTDIKLDHHGSHCFAGDLETLRRRPPPAEPSFF